MWLASYFGLMGAFCFIRLARILFLIHTRFYFAYVFVNWVLYYTTLLNIFVWGNFLFWKNVNSDTCSDSIANMSTESQYDPQILWAIVGSTLALNWTAIILCM